MARLDLDLTATMSFRDGRALKEFNLAHRLAHAQFAASISSAYGIAVAGFDVADERARAAWELVMLKPDEVPFEAREVLRGWLRLHADLHQSEYDAIGAGIAYDLSNVDFGDAQQFATWMLEHQQIHATVADTLGITA